MRRLICIGLLSAAALAQHSQPLPPAVNPLEQEIEETHLREVMAAAGNSQVDIIRAFEEHLREFPKTTRRPMIERTIVKAALETNDKRRIVKYGKRLIERDDATFTVLEHVTRALLDSDHPKTAEQALGYAKLYETSLAKIDPESRPQPAARLDVRRQLDEHRGRALVFQARASGNLGRLEEAVGLAKRSFDIHPSAEAAREIGRWLAALGSDDEAIRRYATAFAIPDPRVTASHRARDRAELAQLWNKNHDSEAGLGDVILEAYDEAAAKLIAKREEYDLIDPNSGFTDPMEFTLSGLDGARLELASLKGKVVILDFWATWCGPCRAQLPLYEKVMKNYAHRDDIVFLNINTDEDRSVVEPFLKRNQWNKTVWFEDGLQKALQVSSIPTTVIFDKNGNVASRINGFVMGHFVDMLTSRIEQTLAEE